MGSSSPNQGLNLGPTALGAQSFIVWTAREVPPLSIDLPILDISVIIQNVCVILMTGLMFPKVH